MKKKLVNRNFGFGSKLLFILNAILVIALLMSYLSLFVSPASNWLLPFLGLIYPYLLFTNLAFALFWLLRRKWVFLLSLLAVAFGWQIITRTIQIKAPGPDPVDVDAYRITSYNVRNMSNNNMLRPDYGIRDGIVSMLSAKQHDILCLQEFEAYGRDPLAFIDSMSTVLGMPGVEYIRYNTVKITKRLDAIITFSKFPILSSQSLQQEEGHNFCLINDLLIGQDTVRLFNVHLESVRLKHEDYTFIDELDLKFKEEENLKEGSLRIFNKLKTAYGRRSLQVGLLKEELARSPYPVILCGDFNDTPCSYTYQVLARDKKDAFIERGKGLGNTYAGGLPSLRIDYLLFGPEFQPIGFESGKYKLSDHYPISSTFVRNRVE